jgi:RNA polymerase sigma factor (sigma-70 family)
MTPSLSATVLRAQSDARVVALIKQGHERAFEALVERYRRPLHRYVRRVLSESRTEDVLQQTFLKAWSSLQDGAEVRDPRPWLYRIAQNTALDALKRAGYDYAELHESLRSPGGPDADLERQTVMRETLAGVAALPPNQREALLRTAVAGDSRAQVAHDLGLTDGAVRQLVYRARVTLRAAATALTPTPIVIWAAGAASSVAPNAGRLAELGAAGGAGLLLKGGVVLVATGVLVTGPVALHDFSKHRNVGPDAAAADAPAHTAPAAEWVSNGGASRVSSSTSGSNRAGGSASRGRAGGNHSGRDRRSGHSGSGPSVSEPQSGSGREGSGGGGSDHPGSGHRASGDGAGDHPGSVHSGSGDGSGGGDHGSDTGVDGSGGAPRGEGSASSPPSSGAPPPDASGSGDSSDRSGHADGSLGDLPKPPPD